MATMAIKGTGIIIVVITTFTAKSGPGTGHRTSVTWTSEQGWPTTAASESNRNTGPKAEAETVDVSLLQAITSGLWTSVESTTAT